MDEVRAAQKLGSFICRKAWREMFLELPDEAAGCLIKALYRYTMGNPAEPEDQTLRAVYRLMIRGVNADAARYFGRNKGGVHEEGNAGGAAGDPVEAERAGECSLDGRGMGGSPGPEG